MDLKNHRIAVIVALLLAASCTPREKASPQEASTYNSSTGEVMCKIHNIPIMNSDGFRTDGSAMWSPTEEYVKYSSRYPNHIPFGSGLSKTKYRPEPKTFRFCPECQNKFEASIR